jgi:hypothetical protein
MDASAAVASNGLMSLESISMTDSVLDPRCQEMFRFEQHQEQSNSNYSFVATNADTKPIAQIDGALLNNTNDMTMGISSINKNIDAKKNKKNVKCSIKKENNTSTKKHALKTNGGPKKARKTSGLKISSQLNNNLKAFSDNQTFLDSFNGFSMSGGGNSSINKVMASQSQQVNCSSVTEEDLGGELSLNSSKNAHETKSINLTNLLYLY